MAKSTKAKGQPEQVKGKGKKAENKSVSPAIANAPVVGSEVSSAHKSARENFFRCRMDNIDVSKYTAYGDQEKAFSESGELLYNVKSSLHYKVCQSILTLLKGLTITQCEAILDGVKDELKNVSEVRN